MALNPQFNSRKQWLTSLGFVAACWLIAHLLPRRRWYRAALALARFLTRSAGRFAPPGQNVNAASLTPRLLHRLLDLLSGHDAFFPIPIRVEGEDILRSYASEPGGFVCCSAHIPFVKLFLPLARQAIGSERPARVIAREPVGNNEVSAWGDNHWQAIRTDHAALLHTRSLLRKNGCLLLAVDKEQGEYISSNIFRFVGKMRSHILMWFTQLQPDGAILLRIVLPPGPYCRDEEEIRANLDFVAENVGRILRGDAIESGEEKQLRLQHSPQGQRSREMNRIQLYSNAQLETRMRRLRAMLVDADGAGTPQRKLLEERLSLMQLELETRAGVSGLA